MSLWHKGYVYGYVGKMETRAAQLGIIGITDWVSHGSADDEGNYTLYLPKGGRYWLAGRFYAMKMPQPDEPFARYERSSDHSVLVEKGQFLEGIDLVLRPYDGDPSGGAMPMH